MADGLDWIELVVKAAKLLGLNPVRVRWRLRAWRDRVLAGKGRAGMEGRALTRGIKLCPNCRSLNSADSRNCARCGHRLHSLPVELILRLLRRLGVGIYAETFIALCCLVAYVIGAIAAGGAPNLIGADTRELVALGGNFPPLVLAGEWWRLWTAVFLHAGLVHLAFNLYALLLIAPPAREYYGSNRFLLVYTISGIAASAGSLFWNLHTGANAVSIGASGAIAGIIGLMMVRGQKDGTPAGVELRNGMVRWMAYVVIFGFFIGADNAAHIAGFAAGALCALALPRTLRPRYPRAERAWGTLALLLAAAAVAGIGWLMASMPVMPPAAGF